MRAWREALLGLCSIGLGAQPPGISQNGVMSAAAHTPTALPGGEIARGARFLIRGVRLGAELSSVQVTLHHGGRRIQVPVRSAQPLEIEALMPPQAPAGAGELVVETSEGPAKPFAISLVDSRLGLYAANGRGWGRGRIENLGAGGRVSANTPANPAQPGGMAAVLATGLGNARQVEMVIGGRQTPAASIQREFEPGVEKIQFRVPIGAPTGCFVPVYARTRGTAPSNIVTMAIAAAQSPCSQSDQLLTAAGAGRMGLVALTRTLNLFSGGQPSITEDQAHAIFMHVDPSAIDRSPLSMLPPAGQCNGLTGDYHTDLESLATVPGMAGMVDGKELDAGTAVTLSGPDGSRNVPRSRGSLGSHWTVLGVDNPKLPRAPGLFLSSTDFRIAVGGGPDVEPFQRNWAGPANVEWTNQDVFQTVARKRSAKFLWRGAPHDAMIVVAMLAVDEQTAAGAICYCTAHADTGSITVPVEMFAHFPDGTAPQTIQNSSMLMAIQRRIEIPSAIRGLDGLMLLSTFANVRRTKYQ